MKKLFKPRYKEIYPERPNVTAEELVTQFLDGSDYDRGAVETAKAQAENASECIARLVQVLFDNGLISKPDVVMVAKGYLTSEDEADLAETGD